jgi:formamidopyrimidine-DNA glycosylase
MPELPEVQTIVDDLKKRVCGRTIVGYWTDTQKLVKRPAFAKFLKKINRQTIIDVQRRGKNILFFLESSGVKKEISEMLVHQKMTGHFLIGRWDTGEKEGKKVATPETKGPISSDKYNNYVRAIFYLDNNQQLGLSDLRKFSKIILGTPDEIENSDDLKHLGPDALSREFNPDYLYDILQKRKKPIKPVLLEQSVASGIGNIYGDEALFIAKINPLKKSNTLSRKQVKTLIDAIKSVLKKSLRLRGTSSSDYRDTYGEKGGYHKVRLVYDREGEPCRICKTPIRRIKIGQRSSYYCPHCQKM